MAFYQVQPSSSNTLPTYDHEYAQSYPVQISRRQHIASSLGSPAFTIQPQRQAPVQPPFVQHEMVHHLPQQQQQPSQYGPIRYAAVAQAAPSGPSHRPMYPFIAPTSFSPYRPNEVKHRRRTTRPQLKLLESTFRNETDKPDAALRASLAQRLNMAPRNVQIWFQNRRAKEKKLKAAAQASADKDDTSDEPNAAEGDEDVESQTSPIEESANPIQYPASAPAATTSFTTETSEKITVPTVPSIGNARPQSLEPSSSVSTETVVHRGSVPTIRAPLAVEPQHQRSSSSPTFPATTNVPRPLTIQDPPMLYNYPSYSAPLAQSGPSYVFPPRMYQVPTNGPLPDETFSFGNPSQQVSNGEGEVEDEQSRRTSRFGSIASVSGSDSASMSGFSFFNNGESRSTSVGVPEEAYGVRQEQRRTNTADSSDTLHAAPSTTLGRYPSPPALHGMSPYSAASLTSNSPPSMAPSTSHSTSHSSPSHLQLPSDYTYVSDGQLNAASIVSKFDGAAESKEDAATALAFQAMYDFSGVYAPEIAQANYVSPSNSYVGVSSDEEGLYQDLGLAGNYPAMVGSDVQQQYNLDANLQYSVPLDARYNYSVSAPNPGMDFSANFYGTQQYSANTMIYQ